MALNHVNNVCAYNLALGNKDGLIHLYRSPNNYGDHRSAKPKGLDLRETEFNQLAASVLKVSGLNFCNKIFPDKKYDLVKIDTQGADFEILGDIMPLLKPTARVTIEFSPYHLDTHGARWKDILHTLSVFRCIELILPDSDRPFRTEQTDVNYLARYFDDGFKRYKSSHNLGLSMSSWGQTAV